LTASETRFTVKPAATRDEKTEHARRLAKFEFGRGRYQEALAQATAVINADPVFTPEIAETLMIAAASQAGLKNWRAAADTYKKLIAWLPAKSDQAELVKDMLKYVEEQAASPAR
jgi:lipopolysaccharide biosynthesis regulator YciM